MALYSDFDETCLICGSIESTSQISSTAQLKVTEEFCELYEIDNQLDEVWNAIQFGFYCPKCMDDMEFISEFNYRHQIQTGKDEDSEDLKKLRKLQLDHKIKLRKCIDNLMASQDVDEDEDEFLFWEEIVKRQQLLMCMELRHGVADATEPVIVTIKSPSPVSVPIPARSSTDSESESEPEQVDLVSDSDTDSDPVPESVPDPVPVPVPTTSDPPNLDSNRNEIKEDGSPNIDEVPDPEPESELDTDSDSKSDVELQSVSDIEDIDIDNAADSDLHTSPRSVIPNPIPSPIKLNTSVGSDSESNHSSKSKSTPSTSQVSPEVQIPSTKNISVKSAAPKSAANKFKPKPKPKSKQTPENQVQDDHSSTRLRSQRKPPVPKTSKNDVTEKESTETKNIVVKLKRGRKSKSKLKMDPKRIKITETSTTEENKEDNTKATKVDNIKTDPPKRNRQERQAPHQRTMKTRKISESVEAETDGIQMTSVYSLIRQSIRSKSTSRSPPEIERSAKIPSKKNSKKQNPTKQLDLDLDLDLNLKKASTSLGPKRNSSKLSSRIDSQAQNQIKIQSQSTDAEAETEENKILADYRRKYNLKEFSIVLHRIPIDNVEEAPPAHGNKGERTRSGRFVKKTFKARTFESSASANSTTNSAEKIQDEPKSQSRSRKLSRTKSVDSSVEKGENDGVIVIEGPTSPVKTVKEKPPKKSSGTGLKEKYGGPRPRPMRRAKFPCGTCKRQFFSLRDVKDHQNVHKGLTPFHCTEHHCTYKSATELRLKEHLKNVHGPLSRVCETCGKGFRDPKSYKTHIHLHQRDNLLRQKKDDHPLLLKFKCPSCPKNYACRSSLTKHRRNIHGPKKSGASSTSALKFKCSSCPKTFSRRDELHRHVKSHDEAYVRDNLTCVDCNHIFYSKTNLQIHEQADHPDRCPFKCEIPNCNFRARTLKRLEEHEQFAHVQTEPQPNKGTAFECQIQDCTYSARSEAQLRLHLEHAHGKARPFECLTCPKRFNSFNNLEKHTNKVHRQEQFYVCSTCGKPFAQRSYLTAHEATHKKESGRSVCNLCGAGFASKSGLFKHERNIHFQNLKNSASNEDGEEILEDGNSSNNGSPSKTATTYPCKYCKKSCPSARTLALHKRQEHPENYQYQCAHCPFGAPSLPPLEEHIYAVHSFDRPFECPLCGNTFKTSQHLKKHTRVVHPAEQKKLSTVKLVAPNPGEESGPGNYPNPNPNTSEKDNDDDDELNPLVHAAEEILPTDAGDETGPTSSATVDFLQVNNMDPMPVQMEPEAEPCGSHLLGAAIETGSEMSGRTESETCVEEQPGFSVSVSDQGIPSLIPQHQLAIPCHEFDLAFGFQLVDM